MSKQQNQIERASIKHLENAFPELNIEHWQDNLKLPQVAEGNKFAAAVCQYTEKLKKEAETTTRQGMPGIVEFAKKHPTETVACTALGLTAGALAVAAIPLEGAAATGLTGLAAVTTGLGAVAIGGKVFVDETTKGVNNLVNSMTNPRW